MDGTPVAIMAQPQAQQQYQGEENEALRQRSFAGSLQGSRRRSDASSLQSYRGEGTQQQRVSGTGVHSATLSSYQQRLAEIRAKR
jgi:hypothetical protein